MNQSTILTLLVLHWGVYWTSVLSSLVFIYLNSKRSINNVSVTSLTNMCCIFQYTPENTVRIAELMYNIKSQEKI